MQRTRTRLRAGVNANGGWPQGLNPTLIIDFVPTGDDTDWPTLNLDFRNTVFFANERDPVLPDGFINLQSWN
jgi:hypothetical protein